MINFPLAEWPFESSAQDIAPQVWSNAFVVWDINEKFSFRNAIAYNVLLSKEFPWHELDYHGGLAYRFHKNFETSAGISLLLVRQDISLSSFEVRPFVGLRVNSNIERRFYITNFSKLEWRNLKYSDDIKNSTGRFRNKTYFAVSLNRKSMVSDNNIYLLSYFEIFYNFNDVRERFFNALKYKLGLGYRLSYNWRFDIGVIYQDANDKLGKPESAITTLDTFFIMEWGVGYIIGNKKD